MDIKDVEIILSFGIIFILWITVFILGPLFLFNNFFYYEITKEAILIKLFNLFTIRRIPLQEIENISIARISPYPFGEGYKYNFAFCERWGSVCLDGKVMIRKRMGWRRLVFLSPKDPSQFVEKVNILIEPLRKTQMIK